MNSVLVRFDRILLRQLQLFKVRLAEPQRTEYVCPICNYAGCFLDYNPPTGLRKHAICPRCGSLERHRIQWLALQATPERTDFSKMRMLHCAPERFFRNKFASIFKSYTTADLKPRGVDYAVDLTKPLPFAPGSFDVVYASHVLEHIQNDSAALANIRRVLSDSGFAVLPVPIVANFTVEYPEPNPIEEWHVRAPGPDYYDRYMECFAEVRIFSSAEFDERFQTYVYEDRSIVRPNMPLRPLLSGIRHRDFVPICYTKKRKTN